MKPLVLNLQINVYPDGSIGVQSTSGDSQHSASAATAASTPALPSTPPVSESPTSSSSASAAPGAATASGDDGPSESDVRTALLAAVKATTKASAVGVLESIAGVTRVPDVPADLRAAVITQLNVLAATKTDAAE